VEPPGRHTDEPVVPRIGTTGLLICLWITLVRGRRLLGKCQLPGHRFHKRDGLNMDRRLENLTPQARG
jgi:hypothetical protein